jgi:hypothetical protein
VLFGELTVQEHLEIFAGLKSLTGAVAASEVAAKIAEVSGALLERGAGAFIL